MSVLSDQFWFLFVMAVVAILVGACAHLAARGRRRALTDLANRRGLQFDPDAGACHRRYERFLPFERGSARRSTNRLSGRDDRHAGIGWEIFDYRYTTGRAIDRRTHAVGAIVAIVPLDLPELHIQPTTSATVDPEALDEVPVDSDAFARRYHVTSPDPRNARDLFHPDMVEFLLTLPPMSWQLAGQHLVMTRPGTFGVDEIDWRMDAIHSFCQHLPDHANQDLAIG